MNFQDFKYFLTLYKEKSFSSAAKKLFITQQGLSKAIRKLEQEGYLYLEQGHGRNKHIRLTDTGKAFIREKVSPVVRMENDAFLTLEPGERREFLRLFKKYVENFRNSKNEL